MGPCASKQPLPRPLVIVGPSGVGKGTLIERLQETLPDTFGFSVSHTTRPPRGEEESGVEYHFVSDEDFLSLTEQNGFVEHALVHEHRYGTSLQAVTDVVDSGKVCILDIDVQGADQVKAHSGMNPFTIFVKPPSLDVLEKRLRDRETDSEEQILIRMENATSELKFGEERQDVVDAVVVNDDLEVCFGEFLDIVRKEYGL